MRALRYAARSLARTPLFTLTAVLILSLSVGAATAVFSLLYALVLRPLPVPNAHQLVRVTTFDRRGSNADLTWRMYRELAANQHVFSTLIPSLDQSVLTLESDHGTVRGAVAGAAGNLFSELGATPALGRLIQPADGDFTVPSGEPVAVLGWQFWQRHFLGDPNVIGRTIKVEGAPLTIIGVAPRNFLGFSITIDHDLWVPIEQTACFIKFCDGLAKSALLYVGPAEQKMRPMRFLVDGYRAAVLLNGFLVFAREIEGHSQFPQTEVIP